MERLPDAPDPGFWPASVLLAPGEFLVTLLASVAPDRIAEALSLGGSTAQTAAIVLSILFWLGVGIIAAIFGRFVADGLRVVRIKVSALFGTLASALRRVRVFLACQAFRLRSWRDGAAPKDTVRVELDGLELEVLRREASLAPGHVLTAQELGLLLDVRPAQAEKALGRLEQHRLVAHTFGSMDGYDGYRITPDGELYLQAIGGA